jgi:hypothetical protein
LAFVGGDSFTFAMGSGLSYDVIVSYANPVVVPFFTMADMVTGSLGIMGFWPTLGLSTGTFQRWTVSFPSDYLSGSVMFRFLILYPDSMPAVIRPSVHSYNIFTNPGGVAPAMGTFVTQSLP